jgi:hypothetical protein
MADLELSQTYAHVQMVDGVNFLGEVITYSSIGNHSVTVVDELDDAAPDGHDNPGVVLYRPSERQYQAALEVVVADEGALSRFAASPAFMGTADGLAAQVDRPSRAARVSGSGGRTGAGRR